MSVLIDQTSDSLITIQMSGRVSSREWTSAQEEVEALMLRQPSVSLLVIAREFKGWEGTDWNDLSFQQKHDPQIRRLAIVAEKSWEVEMLLFAGAGFRKFEIRYFPPWELVVARAWAAELVDRRGSAAVAPPNGG